MNEPLTFDSVYQVSRKFYGS